MTGLGIDRIPYAYARIMMIDLFWQLTGHAHAALGHFPIALLVVGVALDLAARRRPNLAFTAWLLWVIGAIGTR